MKRLGEYLEEYFNPEWDYVMVERNGGNYVSSLDEVIEILNNL